jgi:hypothetical protein
VGYQMAQGRARSRGGREADVVRVEWWMVVNRSRVDRSSAKSDADRVDDSDAERTGRVAVAGNHQGWSPKTVTSPNPDIMGPCKRGQRVFHGGPRKTLKLANQNYLFIYINFFDSQKYYISPNGTQFLINKYKNRGRFLFIGTPVKHSLPPFRVTPTLLVRSKVREGTQNQEGSFTMITGGALHTTAVS